MKRRFGGLLAILVVAVLLPSCSTLRLGGSGQFKLPNYSEKKLSNGLSVLVIPDKSLPYFSLLLMVKSGSSSDGAQKEGLANFVGQLLDKGTIHRSAVQLADSMDQLGADFSVNVDKDYTVIAGTSLAAHQKTFLKDFAEIVTQPAFSSAEIERERRKILAELQGEVDDPSSLANRAYEKYLYQEHPYSHTSRGSIRSVRRLKKKDIIKFYLEHYRPNNAQLAVVGDFPSDIVSQLEESFKDWQPRTVKPKVFPTPPAIEGRQVEIIDKGDLVQAQIRMGHFGIRRNDPDFLALRVASTILGGAFFSRLMYEVRERKGLTYGIYSSFEPRRERGPFEISTFSRNEKVGETVSTALSVLETFHAKGISEKELESTKALLKGLFPRALQTAERLAENLLILRYYGISDDYLTTYLSKVDKLTVAEVNAAIRKHFDPKNMKILVFAPKGKVLSQLKPIGPVQVKSFADIL